MPRAPTVKAAMVSGIRRPVPFISETAWTPSVSARFPAQKKRVIFMIPWWTRWTRPPTVETWPITAVPSTM